MGHKESKVKTTINFGIVGTGRMAAAMMKAFHEMPEIRVLAVASGSSERAAEFASRFGIANSYGSLGELLSEDAINAVYIANRNVEHAQTAIAALTAGKAVLCEKPFAVSVEEGQTVIAAAQSSRRLMMEAMWTPFLPAYRRLQALIQGGSFGRPTHLYFDFGYPTSAANHPHLFSQNGGGVLLDRGVYGIALALRLFGEVESVEAAIGRTDAGVDDSASLQLTHKGGGQSQLGLSLTSLMSNTATVACEAGTVGLMAPAVGAELICFRRGSADQSSAVDGAKQSLKRRVIDTLRRQAIVRRIKAQVSVPKTEFHSYGVDPYVPQLSHFLELLRSERSESDINTHASSLAVIQVIEAARLIRRG